MLLLQFLLQFYAGSFGASWWGKMVVCHREAFHGVGVQDVAEFDSD
jgi:hypothetical protein